MKNKNGIIKKIMSDPVLIAAWGLAFISVFFTRPDKEYLSYIDWRSLGILWGLMVVIQGLKENSVFDIIGNYLLGRVKKGWQLAAIFIFLCFFGGMLITNDVALITFVPFAIMILKSCGMEKMALRVIVLQTIAANLGSMLTPIGNPQNLYLYGLTGMPIDEFIMWMLPYTLLALALLIVGIVFLPGRNKEIHMSDESDTTICSADDSNKDDANIKYESQIDLNEQHVAKEYINKKTDRRIDIVIYLILFVLAVLTVLRIVPWYVMALIILAVVFILDKKIILRADYMLLLTFIGFFIFTGNMGRVGYIRDMLEKLVQGREVYTSIIASQFISNVPATLLLSGFTTNHKALLLGVNLGGLGTLIASMASLISHKAFANEYKNEKGKYIRVFTAYNAFFLIALLGLYVILN
ncbi:MAG: anion permease [Lachnospiraceae bacterium]|nr:anion permease [Lachnospiraceae bacterium]